MAVTWSYDKVMQLIELFHAKSLLWDVTNVEFKAVKKKNEAYEEIAAALNVSRSDVEAKIHTLRTQFTREKKRIATEMSDGATDLKLWLYYEPMRFLLRANSSDTVDKTQLQEENSLNESDMATVYFELGNSSVPRPKTETDEITDIDLDELKAEEMDEEYEEEMDQNDPFGTYVADVKNASDERDARGKMGVAWSYDRVMHFIELFHAKPILWDSTTTDYRYKSKRIEAIEEIARALNIQRRDVEAKIHGLRTQFTKERKKIAAKMKYGVQADKIPKWLYYEPLKFLSGAAYRESRNNNRTVDKSVSENYVQTECVVSEESTSRISTPDATPTTSRKRRNIDECSRNRREADEHSRNRKEMDDESDFDERQSGKKMKNEMDPCDIYGAYVASELRSVRDDQAVTQAKYHINNILYQLKMGHYDKGRSLNSREST